jgi:hypothetical protein
MKKIIFLLLISSLLLNPIAAMSADKLNQVSKSAQELKDKCAEQTKLQKFVSGLSATTAAVPAKVKATFNWVADHIDTILTKKGAIKTLLILGPLFSVYCYFFPPAPVKALISYIVGSSTNGATEIAKQAVEALKNNKEDIKSLAIDVMQEVGSAQATIKINQEIGEMKAFGASMQREPIYTTLLGFYKAIDAGIRIGVPFILGILVQNRLKPTVPTSVRI